MAFIRKSVGEKGVNNRADVRIIQKAFNLTTTPRLLVNGVISKALIDRIKELQTKKHLKVDGLIGSRGITIKHLWPTYYANPTGRAIRGKDVYGKGGYHAPRRYGPHDGADYISVVGQRVGSPISGRVIKIARPYDTGIGAAVLLGFEIHATNGYKCKVWYFKPEPNMIGTIVQAGDLIGHALTLQNRHKPRKGGTMTEHIHVRLHDRLDRQIDPTSLIPELEIHVPDAKNVDPTNSFLPKGARIQGVHLHHSITVSRGTFLP